MAVFFSARILCWGLPLPHKSVVTQLSKTLKIMKVYCVFSKSKKISSKSDVWFWNGGDFSKSLIFSKYWIMDLTCCCLQRLNFHSTYFPWRFTHKWNIQPNFLVHAFNAINSARKLGSCHSNDYRMKFFFQPQFLNNLSRAFQCANCSVLMDNERFITSPVCSYELVQ